MGWTNIRAFASSYDRATQTMHIVLDEFAPSIKPDEHNTRYDNRLRECEFGDIDGISDEELEKAFPQFWSQMRRDNTSQAKYFVRNPRGESPADVGDRCRDFVGGLIRDAEKYGISNFIIVAHGITIRAFMQEMLHAGDFRWYANQKNPANASVYLIQGRKAAKGLNIENREGCIFTPKT